MLGGPPNVCYPPNREDELIVWILKLNRHSLRTCFFAIPFTYYRVSMDVMFGLPSGRQSSKWQETGSMGRLEGTELKRFGRRRMLGR